MKDIIIENLISGVTSFTIEDADIVYKYVNGTLYLVVHYNYDCYVPYYVKLSKRYINTTKSWTKLDRLIEVYEEYNNKDKFLVKNALTIRCFSDLN